MDRLSLVSLRLQTTCKGLRLGQATGFIVDAGDQHYCITNWHVLAGRHPQTTQPLSPTGGLPDKAFVYYHTTTPVGGDKLNITWSAIGESLNDDNGYPRWLAHPTGAKVDVAALPVSPPSEHVTLVPLSLALADTNLFAGVGETVSIVGYPFGITGGAFLPIWKTGHIASEPDVDYEDAPVFVVDATTREGMSGSPVYRRFHGVGWRTRRGTEMMDSRTVRAGSSELTRFMGVYASRIGRIKEQDGEAVEESAELGRVWKPHVIGEILNAAAT